MIWTLALLAWCFAVHAQKSVLDFGAVPNDNEDDTEAFEAGLKALSAGEELNVPEGEYCISRPLLVETAGVSIVGYGEGSKLVFNNADDFYARYGARVGMINIIADNITIRSLTIDQNFRESSKGDGEAASIGGVILGGKYLGKPTKTSGITVEHCTFYDYYGDAVSAFNAYTANLTVRNCVFVSSYIVGGWSDAGVKGEQAVSVSSANDVLIEDNVIQGALDDAIAIHNKNRNIQILNNRITTTGGRILLNGTENGRIAGNEIEYIQDGGCAIYLSYSVKSKEASLNNRVEVEGNSIRINEGVKYEAGIKLFGGGQNLTIVNNEIVGNGIGTGILVQDRKSKAVDYRYFAENVTIADNMISNCANAILVDDRTRSGKSGSIKIQSNTIANSAKGIVSAQELNVGTNNFDNVAQERERSEIPPQERTRGAASNSAESSKILMLEDLFPTAATEPFLSQLIKPKERISFVRVMDFDPAIQRIEIIDIKNKSVMGSFRKEAVLDIPLKVNRQYRVKIYTDKETLGVVRLAVS